MADSSSSSSSSRRADKAVVFPDCKTSASVWVKTLQRAYQIDESDGKHTSAFAKIVIAAGRTSGAAATWCSQYLEENENATFDHFCAQFILAHTDPHAEQKARDMLVTELVMTYEHAQQVDAVQQLNRAFNEQLLIDTKMNVETRMTLYYSKLPQALRTLVSHEMRAVAQPQLMALQTAAVTFSVVCQDNYGRLRAMARKAAQSTGVHSVGVKRGGEKRYSRDELYARINAYCSEHSLCTHCKLAEHGANKANQCTKTREWLTPEQLESVALPASFASGSKKPTGQRL